MQPRVGAVAARSTWVFSSRALRRGLGSGTTPHRTADPAGHAEDYEAHQPASPHGNPDETRNVAEPKPAKPPEKQTYKLGNTKGSGGTEPLAPPKPVPHHSSPRLESTGVNQPVDLTIQKKRKQTTTTEKVVLEDVSCAGLDGSPWPNDEGERYRDRAEQEADKKEYFEHHKASPLSEIKVADTRKPIIRATDGTAYAAGGGVIVWRPEQLDTAEEALRRAMEIWKQNAMRGIPDAPHSRVLRALRGEDF
ncbi:GATA transcription factor-like protein [Parasponia andersonii]|uniref:GATA transcription factor-like protein n=1 Tax=Parasponia andersonii TaxID=3476 RepID=A0A2P5AVK9_PARAD|nr:GATA transcription factor-like protein [Parasponia andersonii]